MMLRRNKTILFVLLLLVASLSFAFKGNNFEIVKNLTLFANIFEELNAYYVDEINPEKLVTEGVGGMLGSLDPYSDYIPESEIAGFRLQTTGKYGGIGATIRKGEEYVIISEPYEGFPAAKAGIIAGDRLIEINGETAKNLSTEDVSKLLKGQPGTAVDVKVKRFGQAEPISITFKREKIKIQSVPYAGLVDDKIGYIRLNSFTEKCHESVAVALKKLKKDHDIQGLVFDLRGNPGGLLTESVDVANVFIGQGQEVVTTKSRESDWDQTYRTQSLAVDKNIPLVVLVARSSASASEIVSGVLQDVDRAVVVGKRTYGKGLVQTTKDLGYDAKLKLTTAKYFLPSGRCIQAIDYSGGYKDQQEKIPDSLRSAFQTNKGRKVLDAGGIDPDIELEDERYSNIALSLLRKSLIFDYATQYHSENPSIPKPAVFELTNNDYDDFVRFLKTQKYDYETESERLLEELKKKAEEEKYYERIKSEIATLEQQIKHDKEKDIIKFKDELKTLLETEIASRYYYQVGRIEEGLEDDKGVKEAIRLLKNPSAYQAALSN